MRRRRYIACLLLAVCTVMLTATIFPHHHHFHAICMQSDSASHHPSQPGECEAGCVTKFRCAVPPSSMQSLPYFPMVTILYSVADLLRIGMPESSAKELDFLYVESLHGLTAQQAEGLRAPPCA